MSIQIQDYNFNNRKILSCSSDDGSVIADVNIPSKLIAIIIGKAKYNGTNTICPVVHIYSSMDVNQIYEFTLPFQFARKLKFSPTGKLLIIYGLNSEIAVKVVAEKLELPVILKGHKYFVEAIAIHPNEEIMASGADCDQLNIWDLEGFQLLWSIQVETNFLKSLTISGVDFLLAASYNEEHVVIWNYKTKKIYKDFTITDGVQELNFHTTNNRILLAYRKNSNSLLLIDIQLARIMRQFELFSVLLASLDFTLNNPIISIGQNNIFAQKGCISIWNWILGSLVEKINFDEAVVAIKLVEKDKVIITKTSYCTKLWL